MGRCRLRHGPFLLLEESNAMSLFLGLAFITCVGIAIWGAVHHFPFFVTKGAMVNGVCLLLCAYALYYGLTNGATGSGAWWLLALLGLGLGAVCAMNLRHYVSGQEAREFAANVAAALRASDD